MNNEATQVEVIEVEGTNDVIVGVSGGESEAFMRVLERLLQLEKKHVALDDLVDKINWAGGTRTLALEKAAAQTARSLGFYSVVLSGVCALAVFNLLRGLERDEEIEVLRKRVGEHDDVIAEIERWKRRVDLGEVRIRGDAL